MKILTVSDEECQALWEYYQPGRLKDYDLILSAGDLKSDYLSFLVTMAKCPLLYIHGNHDGGYASRPPEGCDCIDDHFVVYHGLRILGLGGCRKYHPGPHQYTEKQMRARIRKLKWLLWRHGGVDIVLTHAAPEGLGDSDDPAHWGFAALRGTDPAAPEVQAQVKVWQDFITANLYTCTDEILAGLGQMYVCDSRFQANLDKHGEGTAQLMSDAIAIYCKK